MEAKIRIEHIGKKFYSRRQEIVALDDVNMEFAPGEFVSIVGPSGCGKSTIIRMIDDIIKPTSGKIIVDGFEYDNKKEIGQNFVKKLGFIFQLPNLYPWLTVRQNLYLPLRVYGMMDAEHVRHVENLLEMTGLTEIGNAYPNQISGGTAQRIGVIRAMVHNPQMLMMDEPFGALDDETREKLNMEMLSIWKKTGMTIIFITHNVAEAVLMSERIYVMQANPGHVKAEVKVDFGEERSLGLQRSPKFIKYCNQIEDLIGKVDLRDVI